MNGVPLVVFFFLILYLIIGVFCNLITWRNCVERYNLYMPEDRKNKPRMRYLTELSCEEVLLRFTQMCAPFNCTFEKENNDPRDQMYVLSINEIPYRYHGVFPVDELQPRYKGMYRGNIKYKVLVTPMQEGSTVWLFLYTFHKTPLFCGDLLRITRLSDEEMLNIFAWEVEKLLRKLLDAVRVE